MTLLRAFVGAACFVITLIGAQPLLAATIIDTGASYCGQCGFPAIYYDPGQPPFPQYQSLASRFTLNQTTDITSLEAWIGSTLGSPPVVTLTYAIYGNGLASYGDSQGNLVTADVPDPALEYFAAQAVISDQPGETNGDQWQGLHDLDLLLPPGTYWLSLEVRPGDLFNGYAGGAYGVVNPGDAYAFNTSGNGTWLPGSGPWPYRILGVPEPNGVLLTSLALIGMAGARARSCSRRGR